MSPVVLPPALFYGLGAMLIVFGALRAWLLGWKVKREEQDVTARASASPPDEASSESGGKSLEAPSRRLREAKRHLRYGVLWIALGLFLVISTLIKAAPP
jgi:hypothetical protein